MLFQDPALGTAYVAPPTNSLDPSAGQLRVLAVDDNVDAATSLCVLLEAIGCKTAVAFCAASALQLAQSFQPHLVVLDLNMPGTDGCQLLSRIRESAGQVSGALFVCLTGSGQLSDEQRCIDAGFHRFVRKPITPDTIDALLAEVRSRFGFECTACEASSAHD